MFIALCLLRVIEHPNRVCSSRHGKKTGGRDVSGWNKK